jgi:Tol biopolymer transport system component
MGTAAYMSPDQARGRPADKRADLWAFGCVVYEMLTGRRAFESAEISDTLAFILTKEPDWSALPPATPPGIRKLLRRCLEKDRKRRLADASDARLEIDEALSGSLADTAATGASATRRDRRAWSQVVLTALVGVAAITITALYLTLGAPQPLLTRLDLVTPETTDPFSFALSPDGRQIVFVATEGGRPRLWLRALDQGTAQALAGTDGANWPFWKPDGSAIGFFADGKLKSLNLGGGAPQELAVAIQGRGGTWNAADVIVFAGSGTSSPLMQVPAGGGPAVPVTTLSKGQGTHRWPQFLPDGRRFIFSVVLGQRETRGVYMASLDGLAPTRILEIDTSAMYAPPGLLLYVSNDVLVARGFDASAIAVTSEPMVVAQGVATDDGLWRGGFSVSNADVLAHRGGTSIGRQLVWVDRDGKMLRTMGLGARVLPATIAHPAISRPDGRYVAIAASAPGGNRDVWLMSVDNGVTSRFTTSDDLDFTPLWSPDATQIVFRSARKGPFDLFVKPSDLSSDEGLLLATELDKSPTDWSTDGRFLLYAVSDPKTASDLWVLPMTGPAESRKPFVVVQTGADEIQAQFSPNGRWIAYVSNESGRYDVFLRPFQESGGRIPVSPAGGASPRWSRDGSELFYVAADNQLMAVPIRPGRDSRTLSAGTPMALFPTRLAIGGNLPAAGFNSGAQYVVTPQGEFLMNVTAEDSVTAPISIVLNWTAALGK